MGNTLFIWNSKFCVKFITIMLFYALHVKSNVTYLKMYLTLCQFNDWMSEKKICLRKKKNILIT